MTQDFSESLSEWKGGVKEAYRLQETLEARLAAGETLSDSEARWLERVRLITEKYEKNGSKKEPI